MTKKVGGFIWNLYLMRNLISSLYPLALLPQKFLQNLQQHALTSLLSGYSISL